MLYDELSDEMLDLLPPEVRTEIEQSEMTVRYHGTRTGHESGCRGPLCAWSARLHWREMYRRRRIKAGKIYVAEPHMQHEELNNQMETAYKILQKLLEEQQFTGP
jgi:hypothetical protein